MTLPGECVRDVETTCVECGARLEIQVGRKWGRGNGVARL